MNKPEKKVKIGVGDVLDALYFNWINNTVQALVKAKEKK